MNVRRLVSTAAERRLSYRLLARAGAAPPARRPAIVRGCLSYDGQMHNWLAAVVVVLALTPFATAQERGGGRAGRGGGPGPAGGRGAPPRPAAGRIESAAGGPARDQGIRTGPVLRDELASTRRRPQRDSVRPERTGKDAADEGQPDDDQACQPSGGLRALRRRPGSHTDKQRYTISWFDRTAVLIRRRTGATTANVAGDGRITRRFRSPMRRAARPMSWRLPWAATR
jgi:hypothetical protein